ncbi:polysaccharide biosynthesis protein [Gammaproteobacteria bacterium]|nr:polysaccharide biosynthesis protein [Gammaproteobacteria bacterium]
MTAFDYSKLVSSIIDIKRWKKTSILILVDYFLLLLSFELSLSIRINEIYIPTEETRLLILFAPLIAIPIFYFFNLYRSFLRFSGFKNIKIIIACISIYMSIWFLIVLSTEMVVQPYDFLAINWLLNIFFIGGVRLIARRFLTPKSANRRNVLIYGAGDSGRRLQSAIGYDPDTNIVGFIDDDTQKHGMSIGGVMVSGNHLTSELIKKFSVDEILIAMPSQPRNKLHKIIQVLNKYPIVMRTLPDLADIVDGKVSVSDLRRIKIEDLLRREIRSPNKDLLKRDINGKNILVTGAGGSIGSELCRQIIQQEPKKLILFEINEFALYTIEKELSEHDSNVKITSVLGNVTNQPRLERVLKQNDIHTIYHSAAYKHVPMIQKNFEAGVRCNIFGTLSCIQASLKAGVESFVFISTDKAVRPTNVMGATKRFAEIILQAIAKDNLGKESVTRISMVRFGNVLGSSGSVIPLFQEQISKGGPLTVTDPKMIRYFMTIKEASQLVIQAGSLGQNGEIFLLDMGKQVKILELAEDMIKLSGMSVKDEQNPDGDIEIIFTGIRPGEKLYEELLIDRDSKDTEHKKIMIANDRCILWDEVQEHLLAIESSLLISDFRAIDKIFIETVSGYQNKDI